ncbi:MAG: ADOP family duplicated permease [Bryobacteraceae bacterium]
MARNYRPRSALRLARPRPKPGLRRRRRRLARARHRRQYRHLFPVPRLDAAPAPGGPARGAGGSPPDRRLDRRPLLLSALPANRQAHRPVPRRHRPHRCKQDLVFRVAGRALELHPTRVCLGQLFRSAGSQSGIGRLFHPSDDRVPGGHPLAVLSYDCWRNRYGANPAVVGSTVLVDEKPLTVIGVAVPGFHGLQVERRTEVWEPIMMAEMPFKNSSAWWLQMVARARPEIPRKQLQAAVNVLMQQHLAAAYPTSLDAAFRQRVMEQRLQIRDAGIGLSMLREEFAKPLRILMAAVGLVLLMACTNVANLLLARGAARRKEVAMRFSLGATRARLVRQALTECALLAAAGALLGTGLGFWGTRVVVRFLPEGAGNPLSPTPEPAVLGFTLAISVLSVLVFGLVPALRSTAVDPASGLRSETGGSAAAPLLRRVLVIAQVAFSVVLVVMAALFGRSLFELRSVDLGFRNQEVYEIGLDFPREWRHKDLRVPHRQFASQMQALPGVTSVTYGLPAPFVPGSASTSVRVPGSARTANGPADVEAAYIAPRYFETLGTPLLLGREFDRGDTAESRQVAVVNEAFVRMFLPGERHPDHRFLSLGDGKPEGEPTWIVGVVRNMRPAAIRQAPKPTLYLPIEQHEVDYPPVMLVRTQLSSMTLLRAAYRESGKLGPMIGFSTFDTIRQHIDDSIFEQRLLAGLSGFFGILALVLAAVGLYGVVAYSTAGRTGEIGIRIALGARRGQVLRMILGDSLALVSVGLVIGLLASFAAARAVASILYGVEPSDPPAFIFTALALALTGAAAALLPARRAASLDPMRALRHE